MLNPVTHFFVGHAADTDDATAAVTAANADEGTIGIVGANSTVLLKNMNGASPAPVPHNGFRIAQKLDMEGETDIGKWRYSPVITPDSVRMAYAMRNPNCSQVSQNIAWADVYTAHADPVKHKVTIECTGAAITVGSTICLEIVYKNVRDLSPQFKYDLYTYVIKTGDTIPGIIQSLVALVKKDPMAHDKLTPSYLIANVGGSDHHYLVLEAKLPKYKLNQRYEWQMISFDASLSVIAPGQDFIHTPASRVLWGGTPVTVAGNEGAGYYPIVADKEKRALAYQGITNWTAFPVDVPELYTVKGEDYCKLSVPFAKRYRSADNVDGKLTNESLEIYLNVSYVSYVAGASALGSALVRCCNYA